MPKIPAAVTYAEDELSVHRVWVDVCEVLDHLADLHDQEARLQNMITTYKDQIATAEFDLLPEVPTDLSATARKERLAALSYESPTISGLNIALDGVVQKHRVVTSEIRALEFKARAYTARMNELGGLLLFYAARTPPPRERH